MAWPDAADGRKQSGGVQAIGGMLVSRRFQNCLIAVLHILFLVFVWAAVYLACRTGVVWTCVGALIGGGIITVLVLGSFTKYLDRCLYGDR